MKEKKEELYSNKMNKLQKDIKKKEKDIQNRLEQNKRMKEAERKHSLEIILKKEICSIVTKERLQYLKGEKKSF